MPQFVAHHGVSSATHQQRVDELAPAGYRLVSLSVAGRAADARYAAVWVQAPGPAWVAVHDISGAEYQRRFEELTGQGYAPVLVSATATDGQEVFAAVFEQGVTVPWYARHGMRLGSPWQPGTLVAENARAFAEGYLPRSLVAYGDPADPRFAGVWVQNGDAVLWSWWWTEESAYQRFFDALVSGGMRPALLSVAPGGRLLSVFRDDQVGSMIARHGMDGAHFQEEFDRQLGQGRRPLLVQAGGTGDSTRYAALFAPEATPIARRWMVTGADFPGSADVDAAVRSFMVGLGILAGTVAVSRGGTLKASRGYTWAEPFYPATAPDTRFRIASVSKMLAAAAAGALVNRGLLTWDTRAFPFLGISTALPAGQTADPAMDAITVQQLVLRTSRLPRDFDAEQRDIALALGVPNAPIDQDTLLHYLYGMPLLPGPASDVYSNTAFYLLTAVIERASGLDLVAELQRDVLTAHGTQDVSAAVTGAGGRQPGEVATYDHADVHGSQLDFAPDALAPNAYGGSHVLETGVGAGGLVTSAPTIARLLASFPVWNGTSGGSATLYGREQGTRYGTLTAPPRVAGLDPTAWMLPSSSTAGSPTASMTRSATRSTRPWTGTRVRSEAASPGYEHVSSSQIHRFGKTDLDSAITVPHSATSHRGATTNEKVAPTRV